MNALMTQFHCEKTKKSQDLIEPNNNTNNNKIDP